MLQRNSAFARLNQITRVKLAERSPLTTYWETWNLEAECGHVSGATFDGTHHGWWVERAKVVQLLNHLNMKLEQPLQPVLDATPTNQTDNNTGMGDVKATQQVDTAPTAPGAEIYARDYNITVADPFGWLPLIVVVPPRTTVSPPSL